MWKQLGYEIDRHEMRVKGHVYRWISWMLGRATMLGNKWDDGKNWGSGEAGGRGLGSKLRKSWMNDSKRIDLKAYVTEGFWTKDGKSNV